MAGAQLRFRSATIGRQHLPGDLVPAPQGEGLIVFAHGSGSGRFSRRNTYVGRRLQAQGLGTPVPQ